MDIGTIIGIVLGAGLLCGAIMLKTSILTFFDVASVAIVLGGTAAAALIAFPLNQVIKILFVVRKVFFTKPVNPADYVGKIVRLAEVARRDGILSLESQLNEGDHDEFLARGLRMAIDGQDPSVIEAALDDAGIRTVDICYGS